MKRHPNFVPTGMWQSTKAKEIAAFEQGVAYGQRHWKANFTRLLKRYRHTASLLKRLQKQQEETGT